MAANNDMDVYQRKETNETNDQSMQNRREKGNQEHQTKYWQFNKAVKKSARKDKQNYSNDRATQAEMAACRRDMKVL